MRVDMKILICTFSFPYLRGNVFDSRFVYGEAVGYASNGAEVIVLTPHFPGAPEEETYDPGIRVIRFRYFLPPSLQKARVPGKPLYNPDSILAMLQLPLLCLVFMASIIRYAGQADIIHAQWTLTALLALPAKWLRRKTLVVTARGSDIRLLPQWLNRIIFRRVDAAIDCFGPTTWNLENKSKFPANYVVLPHLVLDDSTAALPPELAVIRQNDPDTCVVMYTGRFHPIKIRDNRLPLLDLIKAAAALRKTRKDFHVVYIGEGDLNMMRQMASLIAEHGASDYVSMLGRKTNVMSYMRHCDIGIGGVAFNGVSQEYTICKKPQLLVATEDNILSPWRDRQNALFFPPGDVDALQQTLAWAIDHGKEMEAMGSQAAQDIASHFMEATAAGSLYLDAFTKLIAPYSR